MLEKRNQSASLACFLAKEFNDPGTQPCRLSPWEFLTHMSIPMTVSSFTHRTAGVRIGLQ